MSYFKFKFSYNINNGILIRFSLLCDVAGAQAGGCKFNKKPLYRYSGCHGFDVSAFNIVLGVHFDFDEMKYSIRNDNSGDVSLYYTETLEQATKILENRRKNISDTLEKNSGIFSDSFFEYFILEINIFFRISRH
jgi:hypothetical protein